MVAVAAMVVVMMMMVPLFQFIALCSARDTVASTTEFAL